MSKAQIKAQARRMVYAYVTGVAETNNPFDTAFDRLSVIAHLVTMPPLDIWVLGGLVTIPQLEQWMESAITQTQKQNAQNYSGLSLPSKTPVKPRHDGW